VRHSFEPEGPHLQSAVELLIEATERGSIDDAPQLSRALTAAGLL
jgi:hypothetical protein